MLTINWPNELALFDYRQLDQNLSRRSQLTPSSTPRALVTARAHLVRAARIDRAKHGGFGPFKARPKAGWNRTTWGGLFLIRWVFGDLI